MLQQRRYSHSPSSHCSSFFSSLLLLLLIVIIRALLIRLLPLFAHLASSLGSLCKACKPEVEVEALVIQGPKMATVMSQVKKLEVSVLVLGQKKPSSLLNCLCGGAVGRGICGTMHQHIGLLDNRSKEAKQRHGRIPYQH
ncbi:hypothetical protein HAX54_003257 [Datura stramonium]|uniref:UspA domain-containing protein n=1 Tax=Datura stramonium TaxID=4076 RepID=A0ABS8WS19_DATST|nr:hypothetical protein [Datura stramonium]